MVRQFIPIEASYQATRLRRHLGRDEPVGLSTPIDGGGSRVHCIRRDAVVLAAAAFGAPQKRDGTGVANKPNRLKRLLRKEAICEKPKHATIG